MKVTSFRTATESDAKAIAEIANAHELSVDTKSTLFSEQAALDFMTGYIDPSVTYLLSIDDEPDFSVVVNLHPDSVKNLYFTDSRAVDALEAVVPNFTAVEVNSIAKQVASTMSAVSAGAHVGHAFAKADYRSAEFLVKVAYGSHTEISKVLLTLDSSDNIAITEYGIVGTNGSAMTISADINGANVQLLVTTANANSTINVVGTLLA
jgi:hypothetical protein